MTNLRLNEDGALPLKFLLIEAADNVAKAPAERKDDYAPERGRVFVETSGEENVFIGDGDEWVSSISLAVENLTVTE